MKHVFFAALIAGFASFATPAFAAPTAADQDFISSQCNLPGLDAEAVVSFGQKLVPSKNGAKKPVKSELTVGGKAVKALLSDCTLQNVPGRTTYRCVHQSDSGIRYELFPKLAANKKSAGGPVAELSVIRTKGNSSSLYKTKDCGPLVEEPKEEKEESGFSQSATLAHDAPVLGL